MSQGFICQGEKQHLVVSPPDLGKDGLQECVNVQGNSGRCNGTMVCEGRRQTLSKTQG